MSKVKLILCDLGDVLVTGIKGVEHELAPIVGRDLAEVTASIYGHDFGPLWRGEVDDVALLTGLATRAGWAIDPAELRAMIVRRFAEIEGVREIYRSLAESYVTLLASVNCREWASLMEREFRYEHMFHKVVYSYEVGAVKTDSSFYGLPRVNLGCGPEEMLLIDDSRWNLNAARAAGVDGIHFTDAAALAESLQRKGIV